MLGCWSIRSCLMLRIPRRNVSLPFCGRKVVVADKWVDLGLQVLDNVIMTRWKVLPKEQCQGM